MCRCCTGFTLSGILLFIVGVILLAYFADSWGDEDSESWEKYYDDIIF